MRAIARGPSEIVVWWQPRAGPVQLRISDLSGRQGADALDGTGWRLVPMPPGAGSTVICDLCGSRLYHVELLDLAAQVLASARPVETPRRASGAALLLRQVDAVLPGDGYWRS
jgi:hypothetical protein